MQVIIIDTNAVWKVHDSHPLPFSSRCIDVLVVQCSPNCPTGFFQYGADSRSAQTKTMIPIMVVMHDINIGGQSIISDNSLPLC